MHVTLVCVFAIVAAAGAVEAQTPTNQTQTIQTQTTPRETQPPPAGTPSRPPASSRAASDTTTVSASSATVHARCDEASPVRIILGRGETVTMLSFQENWVQVKVPATGEEGCMRRSLLEHVPAMDVADQTRRARQAAGAPGAPRPPAPGLARGVVSINGGWQSASATFTDQKTFPLYQETARFTSHYEVKSNATFDIGGAVRLWRNVGVGVAVTRFTDSRDITIDGTLPHPLIFTHDRAISGTAPGKREELATHLDAAYFVPVSRKIQVVVFGGPSFFNVKQTVVTDISYSDQYPFDTVTFSSATVTTEKETKVGFNVGIDVGYYFSDLIGVGGIVRFGRASVPFSIGDQDVGGAMVGGGVRIRIR